jgi:heparin binding hemagglutinin HbhA
MAKATFDFPTQIPAGATRPLNAGVAVTGAVVGAVREYVADVQKRLDEVQKTVTSIDIQPQVLRDQAAKAVSTRVELLKDTKARRRLIEKRVSELQSEVQTLPARLQKLVDEQVATAGDTFAELVKRGETLVGRIRGQEPTRTAAPVAKVETTPAKKTATTAKSSATTAKKAVKKTAAKKTAAKKTAPKKTAPKKTAAKKTAAKKTAAQKTAAQKTAAQA